MRSVLFRSILGSAVMITCVSACGASSGSATKTVTRAKTVVRTVTAPAANLPTDTALPTAATDSPSLPTVSGVVNPNRSGADLTLDDFFQGEDNSWSQEVVSVASQKGVSGIRNDINCGDDTTLELRLNDAFKTFDLDAAEDNSSPSSTTTMVVSVSVNGHLVVAKQVAFNKVQKLTVDVSSANAVVLTFEASSSDNCGEIYPVVFNAVLT